MGTYLCRIYHIKPLMYSITFVWTCTSKDLLHPQTLIKQQQQKNTIFCEKSLQKLMQVFVKRYVTIIVSVSTHCSFVKY